MRKLITLALAAFTIMGSVAHAQIAQTAIDYLDQKGIKYFAFSTEVVSNTGGPLSPERRAEMKRFDVETTSTTAVDIGSVHKEGGWVSAEVYVFSAVLPEPNLVQTLSFDCNGHFRIASGPRAGGEIYPLTVSQTRKTVADYSCAVVK